MMWVRWLEVRDGETNWGAAMKADEQIDECWTGMVAVGLKGATFPNIKELKVLWVIQTSKLEIWT